MRVLVMVRDRDFQTLIRIMLQRFGCEAIIANDGTAGMMHIEQDEPELVLLDTRLFRPGADEVFAWMQAYFDAPASRVRSIPVIVFARYRDRDNPLLEQADGVLFVPILHYDLAAALVPFADSDLAAGLMEVAGGE